MGDEEASVDYIGDKSCEKEHETAAVHVFLEFTITVAETVGVKYLAVLIAEDDPDTEPAVVKLIAGRPPNVSFELKEVSVAPGLFSHLASLTCPPQQAYDRHISRFSIANRKHIHIPISAVQPNDRVGSSQ